MDTLSSTITVLSANVRGLRDKNKCKDVLDYLNSLNSNIICLQDTHWVESDLRNLKKFWSHECIINGKHTNSRGVAILLNNNFEYKILDTFKDEIGNVLAINMNISNNFSVLIINTYGPNKDNPEFYSDIETLISDNPSDYLIFCGDLNITINPQKDSRNYVTNFSSNNPKSRQKLIELMENHDLIDAYRHLHPQINRFTWKKPNSNKMARLDYFIISNTLTDLITESNIKYGHRSDHSFIELKIQLNKFQRGPGTWKFNSNLLRNKSYVELINNAIHETTLEYIVPIYNLDKIDDIPIEDLMFTIDDSLLLDTILMKIRGKSIRFSGKEKRKQNNKELELISDIEKLESDQTLRNLTNLIEDKKSELQELRNIKLKGNMIRSRAQWIDEGERPTKYFCALETKNFLDKTIKRVCTDKNEIITDQKDILSSLHTYYENLFKNRDAELIQSKMDDLFKTENIPKLSNDKKSSIEGELTLNEVSNSLKNMQNDKSPGLDGFTSEFFKFFWSKLKYFVLRCINHSYRTGKLPQTLRTCVITCLPKQNKSREYLKNWRPISLLNVVYKIASASIANRLKTVLNLIISDTQNGFLDGRYIGESTRLVYDIMQYCEDNNKNGLLLLIDFEKAFDSVSWSFLYRTFKFFNFGDSILSWLKLFNNDVTAYVSQCGFLSKPINIQRGCRQGDPIASYKFLVCAEILAIMLKENQSIKGIQIGDHEHKMTQFADDTTILLDGTQDSLTGSLNTLEIFGTISGLKMNTDKTKVIWIGRKKFSKDKLNSKYNLIWGSEEFDLLGLTFNVDLNVTTIKNHQKALIKIKENIKSWNKRYLTPLGKITVIKTFLLSQLNHIFLALPNPTPELMKEINTILFKFLWDNKPDKLKRNQVTLPTSKGGLNMINIEQFIASLKITWLRRLIKSENTPINKIFNTTIFPITNVINLGYQYIEIQIPNIRNKFWYDTLTSWINMCKIVKPNNYFELYTLPLWYNPLISKYPLFFPKLYKQGINLVGDLLTNDGEIITKQELLNKTRLININPLHYLQLRSCLRTLLNSTTFKPYTIHRPVAPRFLTILIKNNKGSKEFYNILHENQEIKTHNKWDEILNTNITTPEWVQIYKICFKTLKDNYLVYLQYKIINQILGTRSLLFKMSITNDKHCSFCKEKAETISHLFFDCNQVALMWQVLYDWIYNKTSNRIIPEKKSILLGYTEPYPTPIPINTINMITKSYIFHCSKNNTKLNIYHLQTRIKTSLETLEFISRTNNQLVRFNKIWNPYIALFE